MPDIMVGDVIGQAAEKLADPMNALKINYQVAFASAYADLASCLARYNVARVQRTQYCVLPADTNQLNPASIPINDFDEPGALWERPAGTSVAITNVTISGNPTGGVPTVSTDPAPHGLTNGQDIQIGGVVGIEGINGRFFVRVLTDTTFIPNGAWVSGSYISGGQILSSSDTFGLMDYVDDLPEGVVPGPVLAIWTWKYSALQFIGSSQDRELKIEYTADSTPPDSGPVGIKGAEQFLIHATAMYGGMTRDVPIVSTFRTLAYGPSGEANGRAGFLRAAVLGKVLEQHSSAKRLGPIRPRRVDPVRRCLYGI